MLSRRLISSALPLAQNGLKIKAPAVPTTMIKRLSHVPSDFKPPTMDELPVPCGCWKTDYDNNQRVYNIHLIMGVGIFTITLFSCIYSGVFDLYLAYPERPADRQ